MRRRIQFYPNTSRKPYEPVSRMSSAESPRSTEIPAPPTNIIAKGSEQGLTCVRYCPDAPAIQFRGDRIPPGVPAIPELGAKDFECVVHVQNVLRAISRSHAATCNVCHHR